jgi:hypothetical protein
MPRVSGRLEEIERDVLKFYCSSIGSQEKLHAERFADTMSLKTMKFALGGRRVAMSNILPLRALYREIIQSRPQILLELNEAKDVAGKAEYSAESELCRTIQKTTNFSADRARRIAFIVMHRPELICNS